VSIRPQNQLEVVQKRVPASVDEWGAPGTMMLAVGGGSFGEDHIGAAGFFELATTCIFSLEGLFLVEGASHESFVGGLVSRT